MDVGGKDSGTFLFLPQNPSVASLSLQDQASVKTAHGHAS